MVGHGLRPPLDQDNRERSLSALAPRSDLARYSRQVRADCPGATPTGQTAYTGAARPEQASAGVHRNHRLGFERVTAREAWQAAALRDALAIVQLRRPEVCFFSAWDFDLSREGPRQ